MAPKPMKKNNDLRSTTNQLIPLPHLYRQELDRDLLNARRNAAVGVDTVDAIDKFLLDKLKQQYDALPAAPSKARARI